MLQVLDVLAERSFLKSSALCHAMTNVAFGEMWHVPLPYTMLWECAVSVVQLHSYCMGFLPEDQFAHWDQLRKRNEPNCAEWGKSDVAVLEGVDSWSA